MWPAALRKSISLKKRVPVGTAVRMYAATGVLMKTFTRTHGIATATREAFVSGTSNRLTVTLAGVRDLSLPCLLPCISLGTDLLPPKTRR